MKKFLAVLLFLTAFLFSGCVPPEYYLRHLPENPDSPIVVAAFLPLTGSNRIYAEQMREGLLAAETRINQNRGIGGRRMKLQIIDTAGTAEGTAQALKKAEIMGAVAAIAGYSTGEVSMLIKHASALQMPMVIPMATSDEHLQVSPFVYRNCFSDLQQMEMLASYLFFWRKLRRGAIITDAADHDYTRGISRNFTQAVRDLNGEISVNIVVAKDTEISDDQVIKLLTADPDFVLVSSGGKRAADMIRKLRESRFRGIICGPDSWDDGALTDALRDVEVGDCIFTAFFNPENDNREAVRFQKEFRKRFYNNPGACETQSFDALIFLAIGLEKAEHLYDFDRNWRKIVNFPGAAAYYTMGRKGELDRTIYLKSFGVDRGGESLRIYPRLSRKLQYSKLKDYRVIE